MPYTTNPRMPHVRMQAVRLFKQGWSARQVGRHLGYHHTAVMKWVRKAEKQTKFRLTIPTEKPIPRRSPNAISQEIVSAIIKERQRTGRCAEVVHQAVLQQGHKVSLRTVERTLDRHHMLKKRSKWKRPHDPTKRPQALSPGALVQVDTVHFHRSKRPQRIYVYTLLDVFSRWAHAEVRGSLRPGESVEFVEHAQEQAPFKFQMLQSDHGPEFSTYFTHNVGTQHRHSRVRRPNDNAHLERFNRTLQEECLTCWPDPIKYQQLLNDYLPYYNKERMHLSLNFKTPWQWCQGTD